MNCKRVSVYSSFLFKTPGRGCPRRGGVFLCFILKINVVPDQENIYRPNLAAVVLFAAVVLVEEACDDVRVKEFLRRIGMEHFLHDIIIPFIPEPYARRHGEPELFLLRRFRRQMAHGSLAHGILCVLPVDPELCRQGGGNLEHLFVQKWYAQLQGIRHAHAVGLEQDIANHP